MSDTSYAIGDAAFWVIGTASGEATVIGPSEGRQGWLLVLAKHPAPQYRNLESW